VADYDPFKSMVPKSGYRFSEKIMLQQEARARTARGFDRMATNDVMVGVISDTHGLVRPQAAAALAGCDLIIHAGDVGKPEVLERLRELAPTFAVRGNIDIGDWAARLPLTQTVAVGALPLFVLHEIAQLDLDPAGAGFAAVVFGHSHRPSIATRGGVLFLNPGSAGPRRFKLPITVARVRVSGRQMRPEIVELRA
jgi:putative phosphoesterase